MKARNLTLLVILSVHAGVLIGTAVAAHAAKKTVCVGGDCTEVDEADGPGSGGGNTGNSGGAGNGSNGGGGYPDGHNPYAGDCRYVPCSDAERIRQALARQEMEDRVFREAAERRAQEKRNRDQEHLQNWLDREGPKWARTHEYKWKTLNPPYHQLKASIEALKEDNARVRRELARKMAAAMGRGQEDPALAKTQERLADAEPQDAALANQFTEGLNDLTPAADPTAAPDLVFPLQESHSFRTTPGTPQHDNLVNLAAQRAAVEAALPNFSDHASERQMLVDASGVLADVADMSYSNGALGEGDRHVSNAEHLLDAAISIGTAVLLPEVSIARSVVELYTGKNMFTGEPLTDWQQGMEVANILMLGTGKAFTKSAQALEKIAQGEGKVAEVAANWLGKVAKADEAAVGMRTESSVEGAAARAAKSGAEGGSARVGESADAVAEAIAREPPRIEKLLEAGGVPDRSGLTRAGRALAKHGNRTPTVYPKPSGGPSAINEQGLQVLEKILRDPAKVTRPNRFGGLDHIAGDGRGARFNADGSFRGLLEP